MYKVWGYGRVKQVAAGHSHAMLLTEDGNILQKYFTFCSGEIFSWGNNYNGIIIELKNNLYKNNRTIR